VTTDPGLASAAPDIPQDVSGRRGRGSGTARYVAAKLGGGGLSLLVVLVLGFLLFRILPGDPVVTMTRGRPISPEQMAALRRSLGLDKPLFVQFLDYVRGTLTGDLGVSYQFQQPVTEVIAERFWPTILLTGTATVVAVGLGLWQGTRAAWWRGSRFDKTSTTVALTLWSAPTFWLGLILLMVLGAGVGPIPGLFPTSGMQSDDVTGFFPTVLDVAHHLVLPCLTMVAVVYAQYLLVMRSSVLDEMGSDYLTTARAKGLRDDTVRRRHAVPNALLPTVTLVFMHLGFIVSGAITVETVFSWPGLGYLTYQALKIPDLPLLQGTFLVFSASVIVMNVLADLLYQVLDPRVRAA